MSSTHLALRELVILISDEMLANQVLQGDLTAYETLVERYKNSVFAIVYRMVGQYQEAEDISQEVFMLVYEKMYQFDPTKRFSPWIHRIAVNTSISALRKKKKIINISFDENYNRPMEDVYSHMVDPEYHFERQELIQEIKSAIMELPDSYRTIITLRYQLDMNNQEAADVLGTTKENIEVKIHRARKALQKVLTQKWQNRGEQNELSANR